MPKKKTKQTPVNKYKKQRKSTISEGSKESNDEKISMLQNVNIISPINTTQNVNSKEYDCKKKINFNEQAKVHDNDDDNDDDDGFFCLETNKNMNQSTLNANAEHSIADSLENDIFMQEYTNGTIVRPVPDKKITKSIGISTLCLCCCNKSKCLVMFLSYV